MNILNKLMDEEMVETFKTEEMEMSKSIKPEEKDMEKTIELMRESMNNSNELTEEMEMEEATKTEEKVVAKAYGRMELDMPTNEYLEVYNLNRHIRFFREPLYSEIEDKDEFKKIVRKYYSDAYEYIIDPGVPAPLRLHWSDVDEATKDKYPTAIECYWDGKFRFHSFYCWIERNRKAFIQLSRENKEISMRKLNTCYEKNGEFSGWKYGEMLEGQRSYLEEQIRKIDDDLNVYKTVTVDQEKRIKLEERIKVTEKLRMKYLDEIIEVEELMACCCVDRNGLNESERMDTYI